MIPQLATGLVLLGCTPAIARAQVRADSAIVVQVEAPKAAALDRAMSAMAGVGLIVSDVSPAGVVTGLGTEPDGTEVRYHAAVLDTGPRTRVVLSALYVPIGGTATRRITSQRLGMVMVWERLRYIEEVLATGR